MDPHDDSSQGPYRRNRLEQDSESDLLERSKDSNEAQLLYDGGKDDEEEEEE